jgi:hypothetical protein
MKAININTLSLNNDFTLLNIIRTDLKEHQNKIKSQFLNSIIKNFDLELFNIIKQDLKAIKSTLNINLVA